MTARNAVHFPVNTLALRRGGLVKAVILRANALAHVNVREVVIEVLAFQPRLEQDVATLVDRGFLHPRVHVRSILRCLDPAGPGPTATDAIAGCVHHGVAFAPRFPLLERIGRRRGSKGDVVRDDEGRPRYVDSVDRHGALVRRAVFGSDDRIVRVLDYAPGGQHAIAHRWIGRDGRTFLTVKTAAGGREWGPASTADHSFHALPDPTALYRLAFEQALRHEADPVLFSEFREGLPNIPGGFDAAALAVNHQSLRRVAVVHSNHAAQGESELPLQPDPNFIPLLEGLPRWDLVVTATEQQRDDIVTQYGSPERVAVVPHYAPKSTAALDADYDPNRFVLVARIHRKKRVDEAIEAFRLVVNDLPDARLDVYGFGYGDELELQIRELVDHLDIGSHVTFRGFTENVRTIYTGACASLQTSQSEGFGMALLESLGYGVPVVAYDVRYGAREVIRDGVDGYVVPWGDRVALARRLVDLATNPGRRAQLSAAGPVGADRFSRERHVREWTAALDQLAASSSPQFID